MTNPGIKQFVRTPQGDKGYRACKGVETQGAAGGDEKNGAPPTRSRPAIRNTDAGQINVSRICTALSAAPFLIWSLTHQKVNPLSQVKSLRMRPT